MPGLNKAKKGGTIRKLKLHAKTLCVFIPVVVIALICIFLWVCNVKRKYTGLHKSHDEEKRVVADLRARVEIIEKKVADRAIVEISPLKVP
jgi:hypothetical protein